MEDRINAIIQRIDASDLPETDKLKLYGIVSEGLKASIWPTLLANMPKDRLEAIAKAPGKASVESYLSLIEDATSDEKVLDEINATMGKLLDEVESVLTEEHV